MKPRTKLFLVAVILFLWAFWRSGALYRTETVISSDVPGVPDKHSVQYRLDWGKFRGYLRGLIPR